MSRLIARVLALTAVATTMAVPTAASADAREVAARVVEQWRASGAHVTDLPTRFLFDGEAVIVALPVQKGACTHVAILGARGLSFRAKLSEASIDPLSAEPSGRASSVAGVLELHRCDPAHPVRHVVVTSDAGRGAVELVVAQASGAVPPLTEIIPERTGGRLPPVPEAGILPPLATREKRSDAAETRAKREGATIGARTALIAGDNGAGEGELDLAAGCHRVELFARDPRADHPERRLRLDIDAELRDPGGDRLLARDRTEAPDARLETCLGVTTRVNVVFVGAPANGSVTATVASWPLPARLPSMWGAVARSKMARVMFSRHVAVPSEEPVFLGQGSAGTTPFPVPVEPGACYVAVVGLSHGHARSLQLRAIIGARESTDERGAAEEAALTAFCVRERATARIEVHARGPGLGFGLAVFRVKSGIWEVGR